MIQSAPRKQSFNFAVKQTIKIRRVSLDPVTKVTNWLEAEDTDFAKLTAVIILVGSGVFLAAGILKTIV